MKKTFTRYCVVLAGALLLVCICACLNRKLYENVNIWDIALFRMDESKDVFEFDYSEPFKVFSPTSKLRTRYHYVTGYADPFLFVDGEWLYVFYEKELHEADAPICAMRTKDLKHFEDLGVVLKEPFHLSYPNVFKYNDDIYMIPETRSQSAVSLYKAANFPYEWVKDKDVLTGGRYVDSSVIKLDSTWYLFTSSWRVDDEGLRVFVSDSLKGPYSPHPCNVLSEDRNNLRNGGGIVLIDNVLYRPAQNCANYYGENLDMYKIDTITADLYAESYFKSMIDKHNGWSRFGGHQFSTVVFNGERIVAMDGSVKDNWINNRTRKIFDFFCTRNEE